MASVYRPSYTKIDPATGKRVKRKSKKYVIEYRDANGILCRETAFKDKEASKQLAAQLELKAARQAAGLHHPADDQARRPLTEHLAEFHQGLLAKGVSAKQVNLVRRRVQAVLDGCRFVFIPDMSANRVQEFLVELRKPDAALQRPQAEKESYTVTEAAVALGIKPGNLAPYVRRHGLAVTGKGKARRFPRETIEFLWEHLARGRSVQTANFYLQAAKQFCRWLVRDRRALENPLAHLEGGNPKIDRRHDRQSLAPENVALLLDSTLASTWSFRDLSGRDRHALYLAAVATGFRASELASLTPASFDLDADPPAVALAGLHAKNRKPVLQPLPNDVADTLRSYLAGKPANAVVWPGTWTEKASAMLRHDLEACGLPYVIDGPDGPLHADFHSLRHTFISFLDKSGATLKQAMQLARHSDPKLTMARYGRAHLDDLGAAVDRISDLLPKDGAKPEAATLQATGTDGKPTEKLVGRLVGAGGISSHSPASACIDSDKGTPDTTCGKPLENKPLDTRLHPEASPGTTTPGRIRTCDLRFRKPLLYPLSYGGKWSF